MDGKYFGYGGYKQLRNKSCVKKDKKLANLRQIPTDVYMMSPENVELVQEKDRALPKVSRLQKLRAYRMEKDLKKKIDLKTKLPPFKPSGSAKPRSADNSPATEPQQLRKPSFIPRIGATLKPPSIFIRKRSPKETQNQKASLKKTTSGSNSTGKKEKQFGSLSPGFPSDISCIEPIVKDLSFAPFGFSFSNIENVDQFDFLPVSAAEPLPEYVLKRSTPIRNESDQSFRSQKTANDSSSKIPLTKTKPASVETTDKSSVSRTTSVKSAVRGSVKTKPGLKKQASLTSTPATCSSMAKSSDLSSTLLNSGSGKTSAANLKITGSNSRDNSLSLSNKAQLRNKEKNVSGNTNHKKECFQKRQDKEIAKKHIVVTKTLSNTPPAPSSSMAQSSDLSSALLKSGSGKMSVDNNQKITDNNSRDNSLSASNGAQLRNKEKNVSGNTNHKKEYVQKKQDKETAKKHIVVTKTLSNNPRYQSCLKNTSKESTLQQKKNENHKVPSKPIVVGRKMTANNKKATSKQVLVNQKSENRVKPVSVEKQVKSISVEKQSPDHDEIGKKSLEETQSSGEEVKIPILHQENKSEDEAVTESTSFDNNQSEDVQKSISLEKNQCEDENKIEIESTSLDKRENAGDDKIMMMKAVTLDENQNEDDDRIEMTSVALDGNQSEDVQRSISLEKNRCEDVQKSISLEKNQCEDVQKSISLEKNRCEDVQKSISLEKKQCEDVQKSISLEKNQCEDEDKIVIESTSLDKKESAGDDKIMMKALEENQNEDDGRIEMTSVALDGNQNENDGNIMMKSASLVENESQEGKRELTEQNKSDDDENEIKYHLPVDNENETNELITESLLFENFSLLSLEGSKISGFDLKFDALDGSADNVYKSKDNETEAKLTLNILDKTAKVESSSQRCESDDSSALQKACGICSKLTCSCISDEISLLIEAALSSEAASLSNQSSTSPENSKNETFISNLQFNTSNEECSLANIKSDFDEMLRSSEREFQWHDDSLDIKCETLSKLPYGNIIENVYKVSTTTTPLRSITNIVSSKDSLRKERSIIKKSQHFVDENTAIKEKIPSKRLNALEFSTNFTDISFIEDEVMPDVNLDALDNTFNISSMPEICCTPVPSEGITFYHYQETGTSKDFLACTPVLPSRCFQHRPTHAESIQKSDPNTLVSGKLDASIQFQDLIPHLEEGNTFDNQDSMNAYLEQENVPFCSTSLLGTPQVPKTPRGAIPENLMTFSPFIKL